MKLKDIMKDQGVTQQELSIKSGIKLVTVQKLVSSKNNLSGARFSTVLALYRVLGADVFIAAGMADKVLNVPISELTN